jgi:hypothetical protein
MNPRTTTMAALLAIQQVEEIKDLFLESKINS